MKPDPNKTIKVSDNPIKEHQKTFSANLSAGSLIESADVFLQAGQNYITG